MVDLESLKVVAESIGRKSCQKHIFGFYELQSWLYLPQTLIVGFHLLHNTNSVLYRHLQVEQHQANRSYFTCQTILDRCLDMPLSAVDCLLPISCKLCVLQYIALFEKPRDRLNVESLIISNNNQVHTLESITIDCLLLD